MKKKKALENTVEKFLGISFLTAGIIILAAGILAAVFSMRFSRDAIRVTGVVTGTGAGTDVQYVLDGQMYEVSLSESSSSMHVGDAVELYVDKENPYRARTAELLYLATIILCSIGLPFFIIGAVFLAVTARRGKKKQLLMQTGQKLFAEVTGGHMAVNYTVNGRHPYKLECRYTDTFTGKTYLFGSGNIWLDPALYIGKQVAVYADPADFSKYYVDAASLQENEEIFDFR
ncbi:MAG: hypothetical protein UFG06_07055 [Lachnospiraceae bacterium]|nr:hypothetical protein [Lachnospiraceae bacterium]